MANMYWYGIGFCAVTCAVSYSLGKQAQSHASVSALNLKAALRMFISSVIIRLTHGGGTLPAFSCAPTAWLQKEASRQTSERRRTVARRTKPTPNRGCPSCLAGRIGSPTPPA